MVEIIELSKATGVSRRFDLLVAVDEAGIRNGTNPTAVSAVFVDRSQSEAVGRTLIEHAVNPILEKSSDVSTEQITSVLDDLGLPFWSMATWTNVSSSQRGLIAIEAAKRAIQRESPSSDGGRNCLILLDGRCLNCGNDPSILRSKTEILDSYFEERNGVDVFVATLEKADTRYPEVTIADFACRQCIDRVERTGRIESVTSTSRFDASRSVPSTEYDSESVHSLAGVGVSDETTFRSEVVAWCRGRKPSKATVGESDQNYARVVDAFVDNPVVAQYFLEQSRPGSQQA